MKTLTSTRLFKICVTLILLVGNILWYTAKLGYSHSGFGALWYEEQYFLAIFLSLTFAGAFSGYLYFSIKNK